MKVLFLDDENHKLNEYRRWTMAVTESSVEIGTALTPEEAELWVKKI